MRAKTEAGKSRSRLNAMKHGAYTKMCLEGEDLSRFKRLLLDLLGEYKPLGFEENLLVQEIAQTIWRKNRFKAAEALAIHSYGFFKHEGEERRGDVALAIAQDAGAYGTIPRCLAAEDLLDRRLWGLFDRLRKIQKKREFWPWKSRASTEDAYAGPIDNTPRLDRGKGSRRARPRPVADREIRARTCEEGLPENDRDQQSMAQGPVPAEDIEQAHKSSHCEIRKPQRPTRILRRLPGSEKSVTGQNG